MRKAIEPDFLTKVELAMHLQCDLTSIEQWVAAGTIPPPHSRPGPRHPVWLRRHYHEFVETGRWPREAFIAPGVPVSA